MSDIKLPELPELRQELERCIYAYADAIEAGSGDEAECQSEFRMLHALDRLEMRAKQAAELARQDEREACARVCERQAWGHRNADMLGPEQNAVACAEAIRARSTPTDTTGSKA